MVHYMVGAPPRGQIACHLGSVAGEFPSLGLQAEARGAAVQGSCASGTTPTCDHPPTKSGKGGLGRGSGRGRFQSDGRYDCRGAPKTHASVPDRSFRQTTLVIRRSRHLGFTTVTFPITLEMDGQPAGKRASPCLREELTRRCRRAQAFRPFRCGHPSRRARRSLPATSKGRSVSRRICHAASIARAAGSALRRTLR